MSTLLTVGAILGGLAAAGGTAASIVGSSMNYRLSRDQFNYQKRLQNRLFEREDNAVQRRIADLRASGLSPVLAAGSPASAGPVVSTTAPRIDLPDLTDKVTQAMAIMKMKEDISNTIADRNRIRIETQLAEAKKNGQLIDNVRNLRDNQIEQDTNTHSKVSTPIRVMRDIQTNVEGVIDKVRKTQNQNKGHENKGGQGW